MFGMVVNIAILYYEKKGKTLLTVDSSSNQGRP